MTDEINLSPDKLVELARIMATPINLDELIRSGAMISSELGWYELLKPLESLPQHVQIQLEDIRRDTVDGKVRTFVKFEKPNVVAALLYKKLTGEEFKS